MTKTTDNANKLTTMKALVFHGPNSLALEDRARPRLIEATDAIVRISTTSICGTDLHILKGDVPTITDGRILGHEGVGIIDAVGTNVLDFHYLLRQMQILQKSDVFPLSKRWLAAGQQYRRHSGRIRQNPFC